MKSEIRRRLQWVRLFLETLDAGLVCRRCGISRPTLRKWVRRYEESGEAGLASQSRRPKSSPNCKISPEIEGWIADIRRTQNLGARRIQNELVRLHQCSLSLASIHKVLKKHQAPPLLQTRRERKPKRYQRPIPGDRIQMDTCKIRPGQYLYTAVDDCSRFLVLGLYPRRTAKNTEHFITERVIEEMHFPIQHIQTDNGKEFTAYDIQDLLRSYCIKFRPIRPRSPHLNGKVERAQQTVLREFFALQYTAMSFDVLAEELECWQFYYNWHRKHGSTGTTPIDMVCSLSDKTPLWGEVEAKYSAIREHQYHLKKLLGKRTSN
jgi:transposase InsO family protein